MDGVKQGNASRDGALRKGWYIGRFVDEDRYRQTREIEVKWGVHKMGDSNGSFAADPVARSMSVLIRGRLRLVFRDREQAKEVLLENEGDYALWLPGVEHRWIAEGEQETVALTVRWPSFAHPQTEER